MEVSRYVLYCTFFIGGVLFYITGYLTMKKASKILRDATTISTNVLVLTKMFSDMTEVVTKDLKKQTEKNKTKQTKKD